MTSSQIISRFQLRIRRKGVALVDTPKGILVVSGRNKIFSLPGGGAEKWESREKAAIRELYEETGLKALNSHFFSSYRGKIWHDHRGNETQNHTKVFIIEVNGVPKPRHEIKHVAYWSSNSKIKITKGTKKIITKYLEESTNTVFR